MFNLEVLYSPDTHKIVGYFTRSHLDASLLLQATLNYDPDPDWIDENLCPADVYHQWWSIDTDCNEDDELEHYCLCSDTDEGFPVTVVYLDASYKIR